MEQGESSRQGAARHASAASPRHERTRADTRHSQQQQQQQQQRRHSRHQARHHASPEQRGQQQQQQQQSYAGASPHRHPGLPPCQGCGEDRRPPPLVMGMVPEQYREAFSAHERAVYVEENRQRERRRQAVEKGVLMRGPWYVRIEYWAGIVGICAFVHQLFLTWLWPRFNQGQ